LFELRRLQDRQVCRPRAFKNTTDIHALLTVRIDQTGSVAHPPAGFDILSPEYVAGNLWYVAQWVN
jgi:hypothetical protein